MQLEGMRAVVTGAASGIGLALCRRLGAAGATPILIDVDEGAGRRAAEQLGGHFVPCDVSDAGSWEVAARSIVRLAGGIDLACLNAGIRCQQVLIDELDPSELARVIGVNIGGVVFGIQHAARLMGAGGGSIIVTASVAGLRPTEADPIYSMTKHAVIGLMGGVVPQLQARNIAINAVCPSVTDTPMIRGNVELYEALRAGGAPLLTADAVADAAMSLLRSGGTGQAVVCRVGHVPYPWRFRQPDLSVADWYRS
jgi:NAD(P)-dependent dehydrogenase (short-subunit alcohol dehydrogenase family)